MKQREQRDQSAGRNQGQPISNSAAERFLRTVAHYGTAYRCVQRIVPSGPSVCGGSPEKEAVAAGKKNCKKGCMISFYLRSMGVGAVCPDQGVFGKRV
jgi:hypothetical protein